MWSGGQRIGRLITILGPWLLVTVITCTLAILTGAQAEDVTCLGDCDGSGRVTVNEPIRIINIELGLQSIEACPNNWPSHCLICLNPFIDMINNMLAGCPASRVIP